MADTVSSWNTCYPRPQMRRNSFFSLNGEWTANEKRIIVPFPPESDASQYEGAYSEELLYIRDFKLPDYFMHTGDHIMLHFGAVDQLAYVFVNDCPVKMHEGGYLPFSADITRFLKPGINQIAVQAVDNLSTDYPYGKQRRKHKGMWYTPVTGIWQSVWLEAVPSSYIHGVTITPDLKGITIKVDADCEEFTITLENGMKAAGKCNAEMYISMPSPHLWTPEDPYIYNADITAGKDKVSTYFALRTVAAVNKDETHPHGQILLNGSPVFLCGVLDQGYFPQGHYIPETPEGYEQDILRAKSLGFNMIRMHAKIEPEPFYEACDRLGMMVMQDIVNSGRVSYLRDTVLPTLGFKRKNDVTKRSSKRTEHFEVFASECVKHLYNHPCVIAYTIFNEGWGQFNSDKMFDMLSGLDKSRFFDSTSGWFAQKKSHVDSEHIYFKSRVLTPKDRPMLLSECGGFACAVHGHFNGKKPYGYGKCTSKDELTEKIEKMVKEMVLPAISTGLCGMVYTQLTDVEDEVNGIYTFDRQILKADPDKTEEMNKLMCSMVNADDGTQR